MAPNAALGRWSNMSHPPQPEPDTPEPEPVPPVEPADPPVEEPKRPPPVTA